MKNLKIASLVLVLGLVVLGSCKDPDPVEPSATEKQLALLVGTWNYSSVTYDGSPDAGDWTNFAVSFTDGGYTSSSVSAGRELVWPSSGSWQFKGAGTDAINVNTLVRDDLVEMAITVDEANLTMSFTYNESINGRSNGINGIDGPWVFTMTK